MGLNWHSTLWAERIVQTATNELTDKTKRSIATRVASWIDRVLGLEENVAVPAFGAA